jgi:hypothetical protein
LKSLLTIIFAICLGSSLGYGDPKAPPMPEEEMVTRYLVATQTQQTALRGI